MVLLIVLGLYFIAIDVEFMIVAATGRPLIHQLQALDSDLQLHWPILLGQCLPLNRYPKEGHRPGNSQIAVLTVGSPLVWFSGSSYLCILKE